MRWTLPAELSEREQRVAKDLQRVGKLHAFLLKIHPRLFDEAFQAELAKACGTPRGTEPKPPALLAMVTLLQAYDRVGDAEADRGSRPGGYSIPIRSSVSSRSSIGRSD